LSQLSKLAKRSLQDNINFNINITR
jgi:hypothetical protein